MTVTATDPAGFGGRTYSAKDDVLYVEPLRREHSDGTTGFSLGFPLATINTEIAGTGVAPALAEYLSCPKRAAAPELFEALSEAASWLDGEDTSAMGPAEAALCRRLRAKIRAALTRATGKDV